MKRQLAIVAMLVGTGVACAAEQEANAEAAVPVRAKVTLRDRSVLTGTPQFSELKLMTGSGEFQIPLPLVSTINFIKGQVKVSFFNKDVLTGTLEGSAFKVETSLGSVDFAYSQIESVAFFSQDGKAAPAATGHGLLLHVPFAADNENLDAFNAQMETLNAQVVEGPDGGNAMLLDSEDAKVAIHLPFSPYRMNEGTIELWVKLPDPHRTFGHSLGQPWFFNVLLHDAYPGGHLCMGFISNNGHAMGGLVGHMIGIFAGTHSFGTVATVAETGLLGDTPDGWHHYALIWKKDGMDFPETRGKTLLVTVDGKIVTTSTMTPGTIPPDVEHDPDVGTRLVVRDHNSDCTRPIVVSDLKIWNYAKQPEPVKN